MSNIESFDDLVAQCTASGERHRLLLVFIRLVEMDPEAKEEMLGADDEDATAGFVQVIFDAHQPVGPGLTFEYLRDVADRHDASWNFVVVATANDGDGGVASEEHAKAYLEDMRQNILSGAVDGFGIFDREGLPIQVATGADDGGAPETPLH